MEKKDIEKLAELSRIDISEEEKLQFQKEFEDILGYVEQIQSMEKNEDGHNIEKAPINVFQSDAEPHEPGVYTKDILKNAPQSEDGLIKVKKVL